MRILAIDTSLKGCAVGVLDHSRALAARVEPMTRGHAERLAPLVAEALAEAGAAPLTIDRVIVVVGPGSFAGVRTGLAFARAFGPAAGAEVVGVDTLCALAAEFFSKRAAGGPKLAAPVVDAGRGQVYAALYRDVGDLEAATAAPPKELLAPFIAPPEVAASRLQATAAGAEMKLFGPGAALLKPEGADASVGADTIDIVVLGAMANALPSPTTPPAPLYLRPPDAKAPAGARSALQDAAQRLVDR